MNSEDKEVVTTVKDVIKAVLDGVKVHEMDCQILQNINYPSFKIDIV